MAGPRRFWLALGIGSGVTLLLFGGAFLAAMQELFNLSYVLYWQAWGMQELLPCTRDGLNVDAGCDITPWHVIAFYAGLPLGVLLYSALAYAGLSAVTRRGA